MTSQEFINVSHQNKAGKNIGKRSVWFNGKNTLAKTEHVKPQFEKFLAPNFRRILEDDPDQPHRAAEYRGNGNG